MNKVILMGRLTRDPEVRYTTTNNTLVASFSLAVNRRFTREGDAQTADFINITAWSKTGEFVSKYFKKGQQVAVVGRIQTRSWDDAQGQKRYATDVVAEEVYFADSKKSNNDSDAIGDVFGGAEATSSEGSDFEVSSGDDLPF